MRAVHLLIFAFLLGMAGPAHAVNPDEVLPDLALEERARNLSTELRCLVCQNQSIDDSDAPLARDLRVLIRQRLTAGDSDNQVIDFVVARYGEFVLLRPRFAPHTWALWLGTPALLIFAIFIILRTFRRRQSETAVAGDVPLTAAEKRKLKKMLSES